MSFYFRILIATALLMTLVNLSAETKSFGGDDPRDVDAIVPEPTKCLFYGGKDPFEPAARMTLPTDHKVHCIDPRRRRSIQILKEGGSYWTIANFRHNNKFWV